MFVLFVLVEIGVFASFGLSGIIPAIHYGIMEGWFNKISQASLGWLILMGKFHIICGNHKLCEFNQFFPNCSVLLGLLYILGAIFYALRVPERWFPGKFDLWVSWKKNSPTF